MMLNDQQQRQQATDPRRSYIVQAPAGSGKTEILTQRFLRLLGQVQAPEHIVALTFTRKAAHEMRERIMQALQNAEQNIAPASEHQRTTQSYAQQALARDHALNWQLLLQPNRLRIMTIDALCQLLTHAIPLKDTHYASISEHPQILYSNAARACIQFASYSDTHQDALRKLLRHLDNRQDLIITLFAHLLSQRDQWLNPIYTARNQSKHQFEQALAWIESHELSRFQQCIPKPLQSTLMRLLHTFLDHATSADSIYNGLKTWQRFEDLNADQARLLAALLVTSTRSLRKAFDHHIGLKRDTCPKPIYDDLKRDSKQLLEALADLPDFLNSLLSVSALPKPHFLAVQWDVLQALLTLLPVLVAHLELQFQDTKTIDFIGIAHLARLALGDEQAPTDLALYLDHHIHHLLIDEFQDTSIQQFELISQLVQGWTVEEGKSLFIVGDPMQSIYRFRAAEVGLFLRAQQHGIGPVPLESLHLCTNFRSSKTLVDWVNLQFHHIFPQQDDMTSGAISFHPSSTIRSDEDDSFIQARIYDTMQSEAEALADAVYHELNQYPNDSLAILIRSRHQLKAVIRVLHTRQIAFQGVDIDLLSHLPHLQDIWSLTQALLMPANRLAWLAFLRSPWCGLSLSDLLAIAQHGKSIYVSLSQSQTISNLSSEGRIRAQYLYAVFEHALSKRQQHSLVDHVLSTLNHLHIHHILSADQQEDLEQYWHLLEQFEESGQISNIQHFQTELNRLYSKKVTPSRLQIMTIHKSKGLEFDAVFLPGLGAQTAQRDQALIRWLRLPTHDERDLFLISPIKAAEEESCLLYDYLGRLDAQKSRYESQRLLYVALTRAKCRLYLFDHHSTLRQGTFKHMLQKQSFEEITTESSLDDQTYALPILLRLPITYYQIMPNFTNTSTNDQLSISSSTPRLIGIVIHAFLQWICTHHPKDIHHLPWQLVSDHLKSLGLIEQDLERALEQITTQIHAFLADPIGQWISDRHDHEKNEYELLVGNDTRIIDRTFVAQDIRWIIDFKTGPWQEATHKQHQAQLQHYAELMQENPRQTIRCGLYYLAHHQWIEWEYEPCIV